MIRRERFRDVIERQLAIFEADHADLLRSCVEAERAYDDAPREEAEERYGDFLDLVEEARDALEDLRDTYARTLEDADAYEAEFDRAARRRFPRLVQR